eukprot:6047153-Pyramimonas_sp.AAC.1
MSEVHATKPRLRKRAIAIHQSHGFRILPPVPLRQLKFPTPVPLVGRASLTSDLAKQSAEALRETGAPNVPTEMGTLERALT